MIPKTLIVVIGVMLPIALSGAETKDALIGTWRLVSATESTDANAVVHPFGKNPTGLLTYTSDGRMMVIITNGGRLPLSSDDRIEAPAEEQANAFATMLAYAGRYMLAERTVIHHVEAASFQNWVGSDFVRAVRFEGDRLILVRGSGGRAGGRELGSTELVWERVVTTQE